MRVLLDECLPRRLKDCLLGCICQTVREMGWAGRSKRSLLTIAESLFDGFVTMEANLDYQQNLQGRRFWAIVLRARSNRYEDLAPLGPAITAALEAIKAGTVVRVG